MSESIPTSQINKIERDVYVSLKEYFEAISREQYKAIEAATAEREKAASILRDGLLRQITQGDEALERHIREQVAQIRSIIDSQTALINQAHDSSQRAIAKAEEATEKRLALLNEFRAQQGDEAKKYALREIVDERLGKVENLIAKLFGGIIVIGVIGVANLVKLWFMH